MKAELNCALMGRGEQFVVMNGTYAMHRLSVDSLEYLTEVGKYHNILTTHYTVTCALYYKV